MVHYKFFYFGLRGRGEPIRLLFALSGVAYEDITVQMEEWPQYKAKMPLGQMPVLEVDGQQIAQTTAILRFLGHQFHRAGKGAVECAKLDMIAEIIQEMNNTEGVSGWGKIILGMVSGDKDVYFKEKVQPVIDEFAPFIEKFLVNNGNGLLVGNTETWVDVFAAEMLVRFRDFGSADALAAYPHIRQLIDRIHNVASIKQYLSRRPQMPF